MRLDGSRERPSGCRLTRGTGSDAQTNPSTRHLLADLTTNSGTKAAIYGATCMGATVARSEADRTHRYGSDAWQRMVIVITDGEPVTCGSPFCRHYEDTEKVVRSLDRLGTECIGIDVEGHLPQIFRSSLLKVDEVSALPRALVAKLRRRIREG